MIDPYQPDFTDTPISARRPDFLFASANSETNPRVTVVTALHNNERLLHETALSMLHQSFHEWEWVIVNNFTTSVDALRALESCGRMDPRIRIIDRAPHRSVAHAWNTGFNASRAPYLLRVPVGTLLERTSMEKWFWFLESHPEYSFVNGFSVAAGSEPFLVNPTLSVGKVSSLTFRELDGVSMIRRAVYDAIGGFDVTVPEGLECADFQLHCASMDHWGSTIPEYLSWQKDSRKTGTYHQVALDRLARRYPLPRNGRSPERVLRLQRAAPTDVPEELPCGTLLQKKKRRLLMLLPWLTMGGADKCSLDLVEQLTARGWEVTVATTLRGDHSWLPFFARFTPDIFVLHRYLRVVDYPRFLRYVMRSRQIDAVLISHSGMGYRLLPYLRGHFPEVTFIDLCHIEEEYWQHGGYPRLSLEFQDQLDLTVVVSEHLKQWMANRAGAAGRIKVSHINIDTEKWRPDPACRVAVRRELFVDESTPVILYAARLRAQKQPRVFARTMLQLHQKGDRFVALVAGDGPDLPWLRRFVTANGLDEQVVLLGSITNERVRQLMAAADIFFLPSLWEGIALTLYEAMSSGLPVVGADVGGQRELVTTECGILLPRRSEEEEAREYAEVLAKLLADPGLRVEMGKAGRERVCSDFRLEDMGEKMNSFLEEAMRSHAADPRPAPSLEFVRDSVNHAIEYTHILQGPSPHLEEQDHLGSHIYQALRFFGPVHDWAVRRGWNWVSPVREKARRWLLGQS
jgi:glycosyltransferase involved in cell wall biosynthesis